MDDIRVTNNDSRIQSLSNVGPGKLVSKIVQFGSVKTNTLAWRGIEHRRRSEHSAAKMIRRRVRPMRNLSGRVEEMEG